MLTKINLGFLSKSEDKYC